VDTSSLRPNDKVVELTLQVPFANADYLVAVTARSAAADASQERLWSEPALLNVSSAPDREFFLVTVLLRLPFHSMLLKE